MPVAYPHLPNLPRAVRRLMIVPFILVAGSVFGGLVLDQPDLFDFRALIGVPAATPSAFAALFGLEVLFSGFFYLASCSRRGWSPRRRGAGERGSSAISCSSVPRS